MKAFRLKWLVNITPASATGLLSPPNPPGVEGGAKDEAPTELGADIPSSCWSSFGPTVGERDIGGAVTLPLFPPLFIYRIFSHF